jgi:hypothetical protein
MKGHSEASLAVMEEFAKHNVIFGLALFANCHAVDKFVKGDLPTYFPPSSTIRHTTLFNACQLSDKSVDGRHSNQPQHC